MSNAPLMPKATAVWLVDNTALTFDRDPGDIRLESTNTGAMQPIAVRYDPRSTRFDVTFEISNSEQYRQSQAP